MKINFFLTIEIGMRYLPLLNKVLLVVLQLYSKNFAPTLHIQCRYSPHRRDLFIQLCVHTKATQFLSFNFNWSTSLRDSVT